MCETLRIALVLLSLVAAAAKAGGQPKDGPLTLAVAHDIRDLRVLRQADRRSLCALVDSRVVLLGPSGQSPGILASIPLPKDAFLYDWTVGEGPVLDVAVVSSKGVRVLSAKGKERDEVVVMSAASGLFTGTPTSPPARVPLFLPPGDPDRLLIPSVEGLRIVALGPEEKEIGRLPLGVRSGEDLRWSLGERAEIETTFPFYGIADATGAAADLLIQEGPKVLLAKFGKEVAPDSPEPIGIAGDDGEAGILGSDHRVGPLLADVDGDGRTDILTVDPSRGSVELFKTKGRPRADMTSDEVVLVEGMVVWRWVLDVTGDERPDLLLLVLRKPGPTGLIQILTRGVAGMWVQVHPQENGTFLKSPSSRFQLEVPLKITLINDVKSVRFGAPVALVEGRTRGSGRLVYTKQGRLVAADLTPEGLSPEETVLGPFDAGPGYVASPFDLEPIDLDGDGIEDLPLLVKGAEPGFDKLLLFLGR